MKYNPLRTVNIVAVLSLKTLAGLMIMMMLVRENQAVGQTTVLWTRPQKKVVKLTAAQVLDNILDPSNGIPLNLYPMGYLDYLDSLGNKTYPPPPVKTTSRLSAQMQPMAYQPQSIVVPDYAVIDLGSLGGNGSQVWGINNGGIAAGVSPDTSSRMRATLYTIGSTVNLGTLGGIGSGAYAINDSGQIVGASDTSVSGNGHGFLYQNNGMIDLGALGSDSFGRSGCAALAINKSGQVVGYSSANNSAQDHAFIYTGGVMKDLTNFLDDANLNLKSASGINGSGQICGTTGTSHAFLYDGTSVLDLGTLGGSTSIANAVDAGGNVVGQANLSGDASYHAFLYNGTSMSDLGALNSGPSVAYAINNAGEIVGYSGGRAFLYANNSMQDLNDLIDPIYSGWTLNEATGINDSGQIVGIGTNPQGQSRAFLLNPLPGGWQASVTTTPSQPVYGNYPVKGLGKDSLIVATHGWNPDITWLDVMTSGINTYLTDHSLANWQVNSYKWVDNATTGILPSAAQKALENGKQEGVGLGNSIGAQHWAYVHLIAHSAGAALIQVAAERIKAISPSTVVHCTFLDAFVGFDYAGVDWYGNSTDWSDSYFSRDSKTHIGGLFTEGPYTESLLTHAYNVDVTPLDPDKIIGAKFRSSTTGLMEPCVTTLTSHDWPIVFYTNTVIGRVTADYAGFGFPLSEEGGNWSYAVSHYFPGNTTAQVLGTPDPICTGDIQVVAPLYPNTLPDFTQLPTIESTTGTIQKFVDHLNLLSGSPAWLSTIITPTNPMNIVSFDARFTSGAGSQGLLTILWDENSIGTVDERVVGSAPQHYYLKFPNGAVGSTHVLSFRLDPFTNIQSTITLTNISLNQVGVSQPFSLALTDSTTNGLPVYELTGEAGYEYTVQASTNLVDWQDVAILANTNGAVRFFDQNATNYPMRFYRGITPY